MVRFLKPYPDERRVRKLKERVLVIPFSIHHLSTASASKTCFVSSSSNVPSQGQEGTFNVHGLVCDSSVFQDQVD